MGCGKSAEAREVTVHLPNPATVSEIQVIRPEKVEPEPKLQQLVPEKPFEITMTPVLLLHPIKDVEVGKSGEDHEAGLVSEGNLLQDSLDVKLSNNKLARRLPPIKHPPIPSTLIPKFTKVHVPNRQVIESLLSKAERAFESEEDLHDSVLSHEKLIQRVMKELSIKDVNLS